MLGTGTVENSDNCDDSDVTVSPSDMEECDGIDNDATDKQMKQVRLAHHCGSLMMI